MKSKIDKLDVDELKHVPIDLSKRSNAVKNNVAKKIEYDELVNAIQTTNTSNLVEKTGYNTKINETEKNTGHDQTNKYIITTLLESNKLTLENFASIAQTNLASKNNIVAFVKMILKIN